MYSVVMIAFNELKKFWDIIIFRANHLVITALKENTKPTKKNSADFGDKKTGTQGTLFGFVMKPKEKE